MHGSEKTLVEQKFLLLNCTKGNLLITVGAEDVVKIGDELLGRKYFSTFPLLNNNLCKSFNVDNSHQLWVNVFVKIPANDGCFLFLTKK